MKDIVNYTIPNYFPKISLGLSEDSLLKGISIYDNEYYKKLNYDADMFSELPMKVFDSTYNKQMSELLKSLRSCVNERLDKKMTKTINPKFQYSYDSEEKAELVQLVSEWSEGNALLYFSFESDQKDSNFGLVWNDSKKKNYQTRSGNLYLNDMKDIVKETVDFIFRVFNI